MVALPQPGDVSASFTKAMAKRDIHKLITSPLKNKPVRKKPQK
jgi:hypothetical protein